MHRLAVVCTRLNDFAAASEYYDRALQLSPDNAAILSDAGYARYLAGQPAEAEKLLRRAVALAPKDVRAHNNLAVVVGVTGRLDESLALFQKVNPPASAWINLAYVYQLRKEPDLALLCYQRAQALDASVQIPQGLLVQAKPADPVVVADADLPPSPSVEPPRTQQRGAHPLQDVADSSSEQSGVISVETDDSVTTVVVKSLTASDGVDSKGPECRPVESSAPESEDVSWIEAEKSKLAERRGRDGLKGFCPVALCDERKLVDAQEQFTAEHQGQVYHFASSDAVEKFRADPEKYAPVAGGLDVVAVRQGSEVVAGSLDYAVWYRDKLYLFSSPQRKADFCASPRLFAPDAR
jgi:tetratricopeptide (TPR) repeat protein